MTSILYCPGSSGNCTRKWNNFTIVLIVFLLVVFALVWNKNIRTKPLTGLQLPPRDCCVIWFLFTNTWTAKLFCLNTSGIDHFQGSEISSSRKLRPRILRSWKLMIVTNPKCQIAQSRVDNWRLTRDLIYFYSKQGRRHFSRNVEWTSIPRKLRMRKQKTKTTVPLDIVPERRTKRCSPRFRPGGRFCELRFRYQSSPTGIEGEISRPLDHRWQIPFIHSTRFISSSNFYLYNTAF